MEEMMCWSCKRSKTGISPRNIEDIDKNCELPSILRALQLDENRLHCPHYSMNEKVCNCGSEPCNSEAPKSVKDTYPYGDEPIQDSAVEGDKCPNCEHVFYSDDVQRMKRIEEMRDEGYMQRQQGWKKEMGL